jgi:hypothetical protein
MRTRINSLKGMDSIGRDKVRIRKLTSRPKRFQKFIYLTLPQPFLRRD